MKLPSGDVFYVIIQMGFLVALIIWGLNTRIELLSPNTFERGYNRCIDDIRASVGYRDIPGVMNISLPPLTADNLTLAQYRYLDPPVLPNVTACACANETKTPIRRA